MPVPQSHPSLEELRAFVAGQSTASDMHALETHLHACPECRELVGATFPDSPFVELLRRAGERSSETAVNRAGPSGTSIQKTVLPNLKAETIPIELQQHSKWNVRRRLGAGGMGEVYLVHHALMKRDQVVKLIRPEYLKNEEFLQRFLREIEILAQLEHPNIVKAHDAEWVGSCVTLSMEYVEGTDLDKLVAARGPLPSGEACGAILQALTGLDYAHQQGLVHRDIKPSNLLLSKEGVVKIADFGLANLRGNDSSGGQLTEKFTQMGTPDYMSPEQANDAKEVDIRADLYSFGCTLYFLLTGKAPFQAPGRTVMDILISHRIETPVPVSSSRPDLPGGLDEVVARFLAKNPDARPQTPAEAVELLAPFAGVVPVPPRSGISPGPDSPLTPTSVGDRKTKIDAPATFVEPVPPKPRGKAGMFVLGALGLVLALVVGVFVLRKETAHGTIVVENVPEDAEVQLAGEEIKLSRAGDTVSVRFEKEGERKLRVVQNGKELWTTDVSLKLGEDKIRLRYEPKPETRVAEKTKETKRVTGVEPKKETPPEKKAPAADGFVSLIGGENWEANWTEQNKGSASKWKKVSDYFVCDGRESAEGSRLVTVREFENFHLRAVMKYLDGSARLLFFRAQSSDFLPTNCRGYVTRLAVEPKSKKDGKKEPYEPDFPGSLGEARPDARVQWLQGAEDSLLSDGRDFQLDILAQGPWLATYINQKLATVVRDDSFQRGHFFLPTSARASREIRSMEVRELRPGECPTISSDPNAVAVQASEQLRKGSTWQATILGAKKTGVIFQLRNVEPVSPTLARAEFNGTMKKVNDATVDLELFGPYVQFRLSAGKVQVHYSGAFGPDGFEMYWHGPGPENTFRQGKVHLAPGPTR